MGRMDGGAPSNRVPREDGTEMPSSRSEPAVGGISYACAMSYVAPRPDLPPDRRRADLRRQHRQVGPADVPARARAMVVAADREIGPRAVPHSVLPSGRRRSCHSFSSSFLIWMMISSRRSTRSSPCTITGVSAPLSRACQRRSTSRKDFPSGELSLNRFLRDSVFVSHQ